jgi:hypothetical protein
LTKSIRTAIGDMTDLQGDRVNTHTVVWIWFVESTSVECVFFIARLGLSVTHRGEVVYSTSVECVFAILTQKDARRRGRQ